VFQLNSSLHEFLDLKFTFVLGGLNLLCNP